MSRKTINGKRKCNSFFAEARRGFPQQDRQKPMGIGCGTAKHGESCQTAKSDRLPKKKNLYSKMHLIIKEEIKSDSRDYSKRNVKALRKGKFLEFAGMQLFYDDFDSTLNMLNHPDFYHAKPSLFMAQTFLVCAKILDRDNEK